MALLLAGCDATPKVAASDMQAAGNATALALEPKARAPTGDERPQTDPLAEAAELYAASEQPIGLSEGALDTQPPHYFDVIDCGEEARSFDPRRSDATQAEIVARRLALLRRSLGLIGYSAEVIDPPLHDYREAALREHGITDDRWSKNLEVLAHDLEAARERSQPSLPPIRAEGGCGAAETPVLLKTKPAGGRLWIITKFGFDLCRAQRIDAWDRQACTRWSETGGDRPMELSGNYLYQVQWPDGARTRGDQRIDPSGDGGDEDQPQVITIARQ